MVQITPELIRRRAEHNDKEIGTLEELSLHQENIEKIDHLQHWCRHLQILLLQSNLIQRIENLGKLKKLRYLNLALNNIERVENLEGLECLEKLDLTLNFIGDLFSVATLQKNIHLSCLILTGNPCADFQHYREYVITELCQLNELDCKGITRSERLLARQGYSEKLKCIGECQNCYLRKRAEDKQSQQEEHSDYDDQEFWKRPSKNTPEERILISKMAQKARDQNEKYHPNTEPKKVKQLFNKEGKPLNVNQPKIPFRLFDEDESKVLDVSVYRYLNTSYIDVDVQPSYVTIRIKGQVLQVVLEEEINVSETTCRRSQTTGHLEIRMPLHNPKKIIGSKKKQSKEMLKREEKILLEVQEVAPKPDVRAIVKHEDGLDDPSVPPLEFGK